MKGPITKRQLGLLLIALGGGAIILLLAADLVGVSQYGGIGPTQRAALAAAAAALLVGISLLPLGNRPA